MQTPSLRKTALIQTFKETTASASCIKNKGTIISTVDYVVNRSWIFHSGSTSHSYNLNHCSECASKIMKHWADPF